MASRCTGTAEEARGAVAFCANADGGSDQQSETSAIPANEKNAGMFVQHLLQTSAPAR
jgi:hypothetical protein